MSIDAKKLLKVANKHLAAQKPQLAVNKYSLIIKNVNNCEEAYLMRGIVLSQMGQIENATLDLIESIRINSKNDKSHTALAELYNNTNNIEKTIHHSESAIKINPNNRRALQLLVNTCIRNGDKLQNENNSLAAEDNYDIAFKYFDSDVRFLYKLAHLKYRNGKTKESESLIKKILNLDSKHIQAKSLLAFIYEQQGNLQKGDEIIIKLLEENPDSPLVCMTYAKYAIREKKYSEAIDLLTPFVDKESYDKNDKTVFFMLLGKLYDLSKNYDKAIEAYTIANQAQPGSYNPNLYVNYISDTINFFSKEHYKSLPSSNCQSDELIFIVGMMRSGTTLVEQILSSHSKIYGAGELNTVYESIESTKKTYSFNLDFPAFLDQCDTYIMQEVSEKLMKAIRQHDQAHEKISDKMPHNFHFIGFIHKLFPNAKIINCVRDARDTCLSCYFERFSGFHPYAYNLKSLGIHYKQYTRLMSHWTEVLKIPIHTISYEDLVSDTNNQVKALLRYVDVEWEDSCLEFHKNKRDVKTASYNQVNKKIYSTSVDRWRNYEKHISQLMEGLE